MAGRVLPPLTHQLRISDRNRHWPSLSILPDTAEHHCLGKTGLKTNGAAPFRIQGRHPSLEQHAIGSIDEDHKNIL
jgi:hypothetical protein